MTSSKDAWRAIVCDLDGTLATSKNPIDAEMAELISRLLSTRYFSVLGGGSSSLFFYQVVEPLALHGIEHFSRLGLFPTSGARGYTFVENDWREAYARLIAPHDVMQIRKAFDLAFSQTNYAHPPQIHGELIEDRGTAVVFSAMGQKAPLEVKEEWNKKDCRLLLRQTLAELLPNYEIKIGGLTSIDVTHKGVDKAYGIERIKELFSLETSDIVYLGDALFAGGNDEPVKRAGVTTIQVTSPEDTKHLFRSWL